MKHIIINVGRQVGAGGQEIGRMLAKDFEAQYYDRELLNLAAKESGFSEKFFKQNDEKKGFLRGLFNVQAPHIIGGRKRVCSSFRAMPFARLPVRAVVFSWDVVPTIY